MLHFIKSVKGIHPPFIFMNHFILVRVVLRIHHGWDVSVLHDTKHTFTTGAILYNLSICWRVPERFFGTHRKPMQT